MPLLTKKRGGKIVIVNLQTTKQDKHAYLKINAYVDTVMLKLCSKLGVAVPKWTRPVVVLKSIHEPANNEPTNELPNIVVDSALLPSENSKTLENGLTDECSTILFSEDHNEGTLSNTDTKRISLIINDNNGVTNSEHHGIKEYKCEATTKKESTSIKSEAFNGEMKLTGSEDDILMVSNNDETKSKVCQGNKVKEDHYVIDHKGIENCHFAVYNKKLSTDGDKESLIMDQGHQKGKLEAQENFKISSGICVTDIPLDTEEPQSKTPKYSCDVGKV